MRLGRGAAAFLGVREKTGRGGHRETIAMIHAVQSNGQVGGVTVGRRAKKQRDAFLARNTRRKHMRPSGPGQIRSGPRPAAERVAGRVPMHPDTSGDMQ